MKLFYKLWPLEIIKHLSQLEKSINPDAVHFLTGDFTLALYICLNNKRTFYYTVHDFHPHEVVRKTYDFLLFPIEGTERNISM